MEVEESMSPTSTSLDLEKDLESQGKNQEDNRRETEGQGRPSVKEVGEDTPERDMVSDDFKNTSNDDNMDIQEDPTSSELQEEGDDEEDFDPDSVVSESAFWHVSRRSASIQQPCMPC